MCIPSYLEIRKHLILDLKDIMRLHLFPYSESLFQTIFIIMIANIYGALLMDQTYW